MPFEISRGRERPFVTVYPSDVIGPTTYNARTLEVEIRNPEPGVMLIMDILAASTPDQAGAIKQLGKRGLDYVHIETIGDREFLGLSRSHWDLVSEVFKSTST